MAWQQPGCLLPSLNQGQSVHWPTQEMTGRWAGKHRSVLQMPKQSLFMLLLCSECWLHLWGQNIFCKMLDCLSCVFFSSSCSCYVLATVLLCLCFSVMVLDTASGLASRWGSKWYMCVDSVSRHCIAQVYRYYSRHQYVTHAVSLVLPGLQMKRICTLHPECNLSCRNHLCTHLLAGS